MRYECRCQSCVCFYATANDKHAHFDSIKFYSSSSIGIAVETRKIRARERERKSQPMNEQKKVVCAVCFSR
jgi:hypothetical protein